MAEFIFWSSEITADGDYSHEIKRRLLLGRKVMTNLDSILKRREILPNILNIRITPHILLKKFSEGLDSDYIPLESS